MSSQTAALMRLAMEQVVAHGTATRLQIAGLDVGAKTGTAQFGVADRLRSHAWVICWAGPAGQAPTIAVAVIFSAINALTLSPALSAMLLRKPKPARGPGSTP